jgi:hypothetical protein
VKILLQLFLIILVLSIAGRANAKTCYASALGGNWSNDLTAWVTTDGGVTPQTHPVAGDTVYLTANGGQITVDTASACAVINQTGYTNVLTMNANLTTTGNITLVTNGIATGTATWTFSSTTTLIPAGNTIYDVNIDSDTLTLSGSDLTISHNLTLTGAAAILTGSGRTVTMTGAGGANATWSHTSTGQVRCNLTFLGGANTIIVSGNVYFGNTTNAPILTYTSGTLTLTGSILNITGSCTFTDATNTWVNINGAAVATLTLSQDTTISGNLTNNSTGQLTIASSDIIVQGNLTISNTGRISGTSPRKITMTGASGTATWSHSNTGAINCNLVFLGGANTITVSGNVYFSGANTPTLTYTSGTMSLAGSTLNIAGSCTFTDATNTWVNINCSATSTLTLSQATTISGNLTTSASGILTLASNNIIVGGNLTLASGNIAGTSRTITMTGASGTAVWSHSNTGTVTTNLTFLGGANTITISGNVYYGTQILTYSTGTIVTSGSTLYIYDVCTITTNGMSWNNILISAGPLTLGSAIDINGTITINASRVLACGTNQVNLAGNLSNLNLSKTAWRTGNNTFVFDGTTTISTNATALGATFYNFTISPGATVHLTSVDVYAATGTFNATGTSGSPIVFDAVTPTSAAHFDATTVGTVSYVTATDIDSATGSAIIDTGGTLLRTVNWTVPSPPIVPTILYNCELSNATLGV